MYKFEVGDIVVGNELADNHYKGWKGEVVSIYNQTMCVKSLEDGDIYTVSVAHFDIVEDIGNKRMKKYVLICNPKDFDLCKKTICLIDDNSEVEITQSNLIDTGKIVYVDLEKAHTITLGTYKESE